MSSLEDPDLRQLSEEELAPVGHILGELSPVWQGQMGEVNTTQHRIEIAPDSRPVFSRPYPEGQESHKVIKANLDDLLAKDCIEPLQSEWARPVVSVPNQDGSMRFCVDCRKLNDITVKDYYFLDSLGVERYFTTLHCNSAYHQIPIV